MLSARRGWDQWQAFTLGNLALSVALLAYARAGNLLPGAWGRASPQSAWIGLAAGALPLAIILAAIWLPGQLGRDIVASGIGAISTRRFLYRLTVQVALLTVLCEEFAFRGVLHAVLLREVAAPWAVSLDALAYGLWHGVLQYNGFSSQRGLARWAASAAGTAVYVALGLLLALVRQVTGGLLGPIIAHGLLDVGMFIGMYLRRGAAPAAA